MWTVWRGHCPPAGFPEPKTANRCLAGDSDGTRIDRRSRTGSGHHDHIYLGTQNSPQSPGIGKDDPSSHCGADVTKRSISTSPTDPDGWFTSSYSNASGACVEVKFDHGAILVRDSKDRSTDRPIVTIGKVGWCSFLDAIADLADRGRGD